MCGFENTLLWYLISTLIYIPKSGDTRVLMSIYFLINEDNFVIELEHSGSSKRSIKSSVIRKNLKKFT